MLMVTQVLEMSIYQLVRWRLRKCQSFEDIDMWHQCESL